MFSQDNMPKGVFNIYMISITAIIGFASLLGTLNLYLQHRGLSVHEVNLLTASFFGLNFLLHFLGGTLGGGLLSYRNLFFISVLLQVLGLLGISAHDINVILTGMALFVTGSGLNVSCINMMLTQRFEAGDIKRRVAFSINYSCMNIGYIISFSIASFFQIHGSYHMLFIVAAACLLLTLVFHIANFRHVKDHNTFFANTFHRHPMRFIAAPVIIALCFFGVLFLMHHAQIASDFIYVLFIIGVILALRIAKKSQREYRGKIYAYMLLIGACLVYAFVQGLMSTALQNFIAFNTTEHLFGLHLAPSGVNAADSIGVLIFGFLLAKILMKKGRDGSIMPPENLIASGLGFNVLSFLMIPLGIWVSNLMGYHLIPLYYPFVLLLFAAAAEVQVNTTNYSMAGDLGQSKHQGFLTGYMFLNIAVGVNLAGPFSNMIIGRYHDLSQIPASVTNPMYSKAFLLLSVIALIITVIYITLRKPIHRLRNMT